MGDKAVHPATGEERCADGPTLATPIDAGIMLSLAGLPQDRKPTPAELCADLEALEWQRSGAEGEYLEVAFPHGASGDWVLLRKADDPDARVQVYDRLEWVCFLDGVRHGEFDDAGTKAPGGGVLPGEGHDRGPELQGTESS